MLKGDIKKCKDIYVHGLEYLTLRWQHSTKFSAYSMQSLSKLQPTFHRDWQDNETHVEIQMTNNSQKNFNKNNVGRFTFPKFKTHYGEQDRW